MATTVTIEKGCLYRRKKRPTIYVKFTPRRGTKPIHLTTGKTNMIAAAAAAQVLVEQYHGKTPGQVKGQKLTIADFCRLPDKKDRDYRGGQFWQYLVGNRAGNTRNRHRDILKNQILPTCNDAGKSLCFANNGNGVMTLDQNLLSTSNLAGNYSAIWVDYNNDGHADLYISKCLADAQPGDPRRTNLLYKNNGNGTFVGSCGPSRNK